MGVPSWQPGHRFEVLPSREPALALPPDSRHTSLTIASQAASPLLLNVVLLNFLTHSSPLPSLPEQWQSL